MSRRTDHPQKASRWKVTLTPTENPLGEKHELIVYLDPVGGRRDLIAHIVATGHELQGGL